MVAVRERIRINGAPISEEHFSLYFFEVWDRLSANRVSPMPGYFRFLTLVAFHAFLSLGVDATILEVGVGGTYDSTNIVPQPIVTGVTSLGIDHVGVLGDTIQEIAWHKGGIFKKGVPAYTVDQHDEAMKVLRKRSEELEALELNICAPTSENIQLGLAGAHQQHNAGLAIALATSFLQQRFPSEEYSSLPQSFITGLSAVKWPGRCQTIIDPVRKNVIWYLDGAHTSESLQCCIEWFVGLNESVLPGNSRTRVLIFNCTNGRSGTSFISVILQKVSEQLEASGISLHVFFDHVIFCTNVTYANGNFKRDLLAIRGDDPTELKSQYHMSSIWSSLIPGFPTSHIHVLPSIEHAIRRVEEINSKSTQRTQVLVTGSLLLVGGVIEVANLSNVAF